MDLLFGLFRVMLVTIIAPLTLVTFWGGAAYLSEKLEEKTKDFSSSQKELAHIIGFCVIISVGVGIGYLIIAMYRWIDL